MSQMEMAVRNSAGEPESWDCSSARLEWETLLRSSTHWSGWHTTLQQRCGPHGCCSACTQRAGSRTRPHQEASALDTRPFGATSTPRSSMLHCVPTSDSLPPTGHSRAPCKARRPSPPQLIPPTESKQRRARLQLRLHGPSPRCPPLMAPAEAPEGWLGRSPCMA